MANPNEKKGIQPNEPVAVPAYLKKQISDWDKAGGEEFGGSSEILLLDENEVAGPLTYIGVRKDVNLGNGMPVTDIHEAKDDQQDSWRLPIASNFRRQAEAADLVRGDVFLLRRLPDAIKKHGAGKGNAMEMYSIKVTKRVPRAPGVS